MMLSKLSLPLEAFLHLVPALP